MTIAQSPTLWALSGLLFNMAGAGLMFLAFTTAAHEPAKDRAEPWLEARAGAALLMAGFFLQATGTAGGHIMDTAAAVLLLTLALGLIFYVAAGRDLVVDTLLSKRGATSATTDPRPQLVASTPARQIEDLRPAVALGA